MRPCPRRNTRGDAGGEREACSCVFPLRHLKNCAQITRSTRERSSSPPPQAPLLEGVFSFSGRERERGPVRDGGSWDGAVQCGMGHPETEPRTALPRPTTPHPAPATLSFSFSPKPKH